MKTFVSITIIIVFSTSYNDVWIKFTFAIIMGKLDYIKKCPNDRRSFRGLILRNNLIVLLISDPSAKKSATAMSVGVGALDDTSDVPGLANLMALVLMKGSTDRHPLLGDFGEFITRNEGQIYLPIVRTREQILGVEIKHSRLSGALEKFVQFFIKPKLSSPRVLEAAIHDVEDERKRRSEVDADRISEVEKSVCGKTEMYNHFYIGTRELLYQHAKKSPMKSLMKRVEKFYDMWYSSNIMRLVVLGKDNLDNLQKIVAPLFVNIPNKNAQPMSFQFKHHPWKPESLGHKIYVAPLSKETSFLRLTFPVPNDQPSSIYIKYFLNHGGEGSLIFLLRKKNLSVTLSTDFVSIGGISFFIVKFDLDTDNLQHEVDRIIYLTFQYLNLLDPNDLPEWIFEENLKTFRLSFCNMLPEYKPSTTVLQFASELQVHPLHDILMQEYLHDNWNPSLIRDFLEYLKPEKMNVTIVSQNFNNITLDQVEPYFQTPYAVEKLTRQLIESCNTKQMIPELRIPRPNELLPEDFTIHPVIKNEPKQPYKLYESSKYEIWFKQDQEFRQPSMMIRFQLFSSAARLGPFEAVLWHLLNCLLSKAIERHLAYHTAMASIELQIELRSLEMHARIYGYNEKLSVLLEKILAIITNFSDNIDDFDIFRFKVMRSECFHPLKSDLTEDHMFQMDWHAKLLQDADGWTADTILRIGNSLQFDDMKKFVSKAFKRIFVRGLIHGNSTKEKAMEVAQIFEKSFRSSTGMLQQEVMLRPRYVEVADGSYSILQRFSKSKTYGYSSLFQLHTESMPLKNVTAYLVAEIILHSCHSILQNEGVEKESRAQFKCSLLEVSGVHAIMISLSSKENPRVMDRKLEIFLGNMNDTFMMLTNPLLQSHKENVQVKKYTKTSHQGDLSDLYWEEIENRRYHFKKFEIELKQLFSVKNEDLVHYFQEMLGAKSLRRRKLGVHIFPIEHATENVPGFMKRFIPSGASNIEEITIFKSRSRLLPSNGYL